MKDKKKNCVCSMDLKSPKNTGCSEEPIDKKKMFEAIIDDALTEEENRIGISLTTNKEFPFVSFKRP